MTRDNTKILRALTEWLEHSKKTETSVDKDYTDAEEAIRALKSLFETELERRVRSASDDGKQDRADLPR